jgi:uncharacterized protein YkwD
MGCKVCKPKDNKDKKSKNSRNDKNDSNKNYVKNALDNHNNYRGTHQAQKLKLNNELCSIAQQWAETIAKTNNFEHSNNNYLGQSLGENIAMRFTSTGDELTGKQMTEQWYEEAANYNYNEDFQQGKGHFAQLVWKGTREVGFGRARAADGKWYAVANYYPAGNYIGQFKANVAPPSSNSRNNEKV